MGSDSNVWHQVHAQREDGVAAMFLIRDVEPRADQPKIFVIELPYPVNDLSGQPDAAAYRRLSAFQEQWLDPACAALGWTFVAWKCEDGSFFLYLYGAGDPDALLEKLAPFDGELGFFNDVDADWSEYAALRELVEQAEAEADDGDGDDDDDDGEDHDHVHDHGDHGHGHGDHGHAHDHGHDHVHDHDHGHAHDHGHDHGHDHAHDRAAAALDLSVVDVTGEPASVESPADAEPVPHVRNGKSRSIAAGSEAAAATHRPLPRAAPARTGVAKRAGGAESTARATAGRAAAKTRPAQRTAARPAPRAATRPAPRAATKPAPRAATRPAPRAATRSAPRAATRSARRAATRTAAPARPAATRPVKRTAAAKPAKRTPPAKRAASPPSRRPATRPRRSR
jgi:hypothetical protein